MRCRSLLLLAVAVSVSGCADPFLRAGTWHPTGVNRDNLSAMVADPRDLAWGVNQPGADGRLAVAAVARLRSGQVKPLPDNGISKIGSNGASAAAPPAAAGPGGN